MSADMEQRLLTEAQAAHYLGLSRAFLSRARIESCEGPAFVRCGGAIRYDRQDLDKWIDANRCGARDAEGPRGVTRRAGGAE